MRLESRSGTAPRRSSREARRRGAMPRLSRPPKDPRLDRKGRAGRERGIPCRRTARARRSPGSTETDARGPAPAATGRTGRGNSCRGRRGGACSTGAPRRGRRPMRERPGSSADAPSQATSSLSACSTGSGRGRPPPSRRSASRCRRRSRSPCPSPRHTCTPSRA